MNGFLVRKSGSLVFVSSESIFEVTAPLPPHELEGNFSSVALLHREDDPEKGKAFEERNFVGSSDIEAFTEPGVKRKCPHNVLGALKRSLGNVSHKMLAQQLKSWRKSAS